MVCLTLLMLFSASFRNAPVGPKQSPLSSSHCQISNFRGRHKNRCKKNSKRVAGNSTPPSEAGLLGSYGLWSHKMKQAGACLWSLVVMTVPWEEKHGFCSLLPFLSCFFSQYMYRVLAPRTRTQVSSFTKDCHNH